MGTPRKNTSPGQRPFPHTLGNPLYHWTHLELKEVWILISFFPPKPQKKFGTGQREAPEPNFRPCGMLERFQVKALCTTDDPALPTILSRKNRPKIPTARYIPTFRPDQAWGIDQARISSNGWKPSNKLRKNDPTSILFYRH